MLKKLSLKQFDEKQLDRWGAAIQFGSTDKKRLVTLHLALYFLGVILMLGILIIPSRYDFQLGWIERITFVLTLGLFIYMAILLILNRQSVPSPKAEIYNTLSLGIGSIWVVLFFFNLFLLMSNVFFSENKYNKWFIVYKERFATITTILFLFLIVVLFIGYSYDIVHRTKKGKLKKLTEKDKKEGEKLTGYASIGAVLGIVIMKLLTPGESFLAIIMLLLSYLLIFYVPRIFILTYLKIRFPEKYLTNRMENEH